MNDKDIVQIKLAFEMVRLGKWMENPNDNQDEIKALIHDLKTAIDDFAKVFINEEEQDAKQG